MTTASGYLSAGNGRGHAHHESMARLAGRHSLNIGQSSSQGWGRSWRRAAPLAVPGPAIAVPGPAAAVAVLLLSLMLAAAALASARADEIAGTVQRLQGTVTATFSGAERPLAENAPLRFGDRIITGDGARLEMRMHDGAVITLGGNAHFTIADFEAEERGGVYGLFRGVFLAISGKVDEMTSRPMTVITPHAAAGIRGTTVWGEHEPGKLEIALFEGRLVFVEANGRRVELTEPLFGTTVNAGEAPTPPKRWGDAKIDRAKAAVSFD